MLTSKLPKCPVTGKSSYRSLTEGREAIIRIKSAPRYYNNGKRVNRRAGKPAQSRVYYCEHCRYYHMTRWDLTPKVRANIKSTKEYKKQKQACLLTPAQALEWKKDSLPFPEITHQSRNNPLNNHQS